MSVQLAAAMELLRRAEAMIEALAETTDRGVVRLPSEGYPLDRIERDAVEQALVLSNWVQLDAARLLSVSPRVMHYKVHAHHLLPPSGRWSTRPWHTKDKSASPKAGRSPASRQT